VTPDRTLARPPEQNLDPSSNAGPPTGDPLALATLGPVVDQQRLPALRTQFDGLLELAESIESGRSRRRAVSFEVGSPARVSRRPPPRYPLLPPPPDAAGPPVAAAPVGLGRLAVVGGLLLACAALVAVVVDPLERFVQDDDADPTIVADGGPVAGSQTQSESRPESSNSPSGLPCLTEEFAAPAEDVIGAPVTPESVACDRGYAVLRFTVPASDAAAPSSGAWMAFQEDGTLWQPLTIGWVQEDADEVADCVNVLAELNPGFPSGICG
jgi:hypothetical protein